MKSIKIAPLLIAVLSAITYISESAPLNIIFARIGSSIKYSVAKDYNFSGINYGPKAIINKIAVYEMSHTSNTSEGQSNPSYIRISAGYANDTLSNDALCVYFDIKATYNFDGQYDALKLFNTDKNVTNFYSYANDSTKLSINCMPLNDDAFCNVRLGLKTEKAGDIIFRISYTQGIFHYKNIFITDLITGTTQDLLYNKQYKVSLPAGNYQNRFILNLSNLTTYIPDFTSDPGSFKIYSSEGILKTEINLSDNETGTLTIWNLKGQVLFKNKIYKTGYYEYNPAIEDGIYIATFISGFRKVSKKLSILNK
jgi:hypothetical protein